ncbi:MAG: sigma-70 family RNA polymerase sigma factor [Solirubrobacterales bacterium]|nr:sigma-70 family RNA polymerase sigma factor [Solirubrobacterales bacterium]
MAIGFALRAKQSQPDATERELVSAIRAGDDAAFEELFSRYRRRISAYVFAAVRDHGRAEDITQEVFISALRRLRATEQPISFKPWIYAIAKNACIDEFRRTGRCSEVSLDAEGETEALASRLSSPEPTPDMVAESRERLSDLRGALQGLSENQHRILVMRELEGLSYVDIGERLGMSREMVESTLFRARKRLNAEFTELESGQRCRRVRAAIDRSEAGSVTTLGTRERRQVSRHLAHCHACRRHAWMAGFDPSSLKRRGIAEKLGALLPIAWWRAHRAAGGGDGPGAGGGAAPGAGGGAAPGARADSLIALAARYGEPLSQAPVGRSAAALVALAVAAVGGGYAVGHGANRPARPASPTVVSAARGGGSGTTMPGKSMIARAATTGSATVPPVNRHGWRTASQHKSRSGTHPGTVVARASRTVGAGAASAAGSRRAAAATQGAAPGGASAENRSVQGPAKTAGQTVNAAGGAVLGAGRTAGNAVSGAGRTAGNAVSVAGRTVGGAVSGAGGAVAGASGAAGGAVSGAAGAAGGAVSGASGAAGGAVSGASGAVGGAASGAGGAAGNTVSAAGNAASGAVTTATNSAGGPILP